LLRGATVINFGTPVLLTQVHIALSNSSGSYTYNETTNFTPGGTAKTNYFIPASADKFDEGIYSATITATDSSGNTHTCQTDEAFRVGATGRNPCVDDICTTALGDIPTDATAFASRVLGIGIGIAGGIALILMVYGSIRVLTSSGDPKRVGEGREIIVAAVTGLLFLIFSVLILRFIGAQILPFDPFN
jgi:hypothetical protein